MQVAAVTMAYNEPDHLPLWVRHYGGQLGARHCYVIDHGSDDGSTEGFLGVNLHRIPRSPQDDRWRAGLVAQFCEALLDRYDWVIHTDVDEIAVADPGFYDDLPQYAANCRHEVATAVGFNLHHLSGQEPPIDTGRPITEQRRWVRFEGPMCKPVLIRRPVGWIPGFHRADAPIVFDRLFLFHLRWFDRELGLKRLSKTRAMPWADPDAGWWQRCSDARSLEMYAANANLPRREHVSFDIGLPPLSEAIRGFLGERPGRAGEPDTVDVGFTATELWPIPPRFRGTF